MRDRARGIAVEVIHEVHAGGAYANVALAKRLRHEQLNERDRRFITELVYGTVKGGATLDYMLAAYLKQPLKKTHPKILTILRMGMYQLRFMDKVPVSAICNTSVELAKAYAPKPVVNMVNAVLRNAGRNTELSALPTDKSADALAIREMHPEWLVAFWVKAFGYDEAEKLCKLNNEEAPLVIRTNTLKITRDELIRRLEKLGVVAVPSGYTPEGIILKEHGSLGELPPLVEGLCQVQDESSMQVAHVLMPKPGEIIIDTCAAPGGKATHIAELMGNQGRIIAFDIYDNKLKTVKENAQRLGIDIIETVVLDARKIGDEYPNMADRVLVDAPCSGLGVLRRRADARWKKRQEDIQVLSQLQQEIINSAARAVKSGGVLVYSTCTMSDEENANVVERFLAENEDFQLDNTGEYLPQPRADKMITLYPQRDNTDGFFIARMRRR